MHCSLHDWLAKKMGAETEILYQTNEELELEENQRLLRRGKNRSGHTSKVTILIR